MKGSSTYRKVRRPIVDALKLNAGAAAHGGERHDVTVCGNTDSTEEGVHGSIAQVSITTCSLHVRQQSINK